MKRDLELESLIGVFTIDKGIVKILLAHKDNEPYKGYWILPGKILDENETLEDNVTDVVCDILGLPSMYIEQCHTFSDLDRKSESRLISTSFLGLIDNITLLLKQNKNDAVKLEWFDINSLPKIGFDHEKIITKLIEHLKSMIINVEISKILFPSDFTLPELQKVYESLLNINIDRRNFRKRLVNLNIIEDTNELNEGSMGRPAKLYRFKDEVEERFVL